MSGRRARSTAVPLLLLPLILAACGSEPDLGPGARPNQQSQPPFQSQPPSETPAAIAPLPAGHVNLVPAGYDGEFRFVGSVLESPDHGPQLCLAMLESYPPQCGGPDVVGWNWANIAAESASGTTWGDYVLVGRWDGSRFTLTEKPRVAKGSDRNTADTEPDFTSPCPEPAGGWRPEAESKATDAALEKTTRRARSMPGFAGVWLDQSYLDGEDDTEVLEREANDPTRLMLNVLFTGDLEARERDLRESWGGALCVSRAERSEADLVRIQRELQDPEDFTSAGIDTRRNTVQLQVWTADAELVAGIEERYGSGAVEVAGIMEPIER